MTVATAPAPLLEHVDGPPPPGSRAYQPHGGAAELFSAKDPAVLIEGPWGTGKTRGVLEKLHAIARKYPGARIIVVRKTRASLAESILVTFEEKVLSPLDHAELRTDRQSREYRRRYEYANGSQIVLGGMDKASRIFSTDYDVAYAAEATEFSEDDVEKLGGRLRNGVVPYQQLVLDCNPERPTHWLNRWAERGLCRRILSRHGDNPSISPAYLARLSRLTGVRRDRYFLGLWRGAEGAVYDRYDPQVHVIDGFEVPASWRRIWSVDFGRAHPFVWQDWAETPDGVLVLVREIYRTMRRVEDHAKRIRTLTEEAPKPEAIVCDHDLADRLTLERVLGRRTTPAWKGKGSVRVGIEAVQGRLANQDPETVASDVNREPRLLFCRTALDARDPELDNPSDGPPLPASTLEELESYIWNAERDEPVKQYDHGMDAMRYAIAYADRIWSRAGQKPPKDRPGWRERARTLAGGTDWEL